MVLSISEATTEVAIIVNHRGLQQSTINYVMKSYACAIVGTLLALVNIPVFIIVVNNKALRSSYLVLAVVFLNSGFLGISMISLGVKRVMDTVHGEHAIDHYKCVLDVPIFLLTAEFISGWTLLMHSLERLCVVAFPIYYYKKSTRLSYSLIAAQYIITFFGITSTVIASLIKPARRISNICMLQDVYSPQFYKALLLLISFTSMLSIIIMAFVVILLKKNFCAQFLSNNANNRNLSLFLKNQKRYTQTALISCCFTFSLVVVSSIMEHIFEMDSSVTSQIIMMCFVYLRLLNSFNLVMFFLYRQRDFQLVVIRYFKCLFGGRKRAVKPFVVNGFVR